MQKYNISTAKGKKKALFAKNLSKGAFFKKE